MAVSLLSRDVSELCIGKPALRPLPVSATVGDAVLALKRCGESCVSVWAAPEVSSPAPAVAARNVCVGKLCMADVICFFCSEANIGSPAAALKAPVAALLPKSSGGAVRHVEPHTSVMEALDLIVDGAQNLVVPIVSGGGAAGGKKSGGPDHCWLTLEDFVRYFLNSIAVFSPLPSLSVAKLGLVRPAAAVHRRDPALSALPLLRRALAEQTSVAVLDDAGRLAGEISLSALARCDEAAAAALAALSAGELAAYLHSGANSSAARALRARLVERSLDGMLELLENELASPPFSSPSSASSSASSSSDEEEEEEKRRRRMGRRAVEAVACQVGSSLVAVMVQALAHRVSHVWVVDGQDYRLAGVVAFTDVLRVFCDQWNQPTSPTSLLTAFN